MSFFNPKKLKLKAQLTELYIALSRNNLTHYLSDEQENEAHF